MIGKYPNFEAVKIEWTRGKILLIFIVTFCMIIFLVSQLQLKPITNSQYLNITGLYIDFWGVVIASLKTPYYGIFHDA